MFISISSVIIDDIVLPDGSTHMACLGGGGTHAVMGMRVWSKKVGLVANIGADLPQELMERMESAFDVRGLHTLGPQTVRAWQLFEEDGKRTEILRTELVNFQPLKPKMKNFPDAYDDLLGVHLHGEGVDIVPWVPFLRQRGNPFILWEPWQRDCVPESRSILVDVLPVVDCVSPNLEEARLMLGVEHPKDIMTEFLDLGAKRVAVRAGAEGSYYADADGNYFVIPTVKVEKIVDQTGAGNAYCGGLAVGFVLSEDPGEAVCMAAVSGSFPLEQFGAVFSVEKLEERAKERLKACWKVFQKINAN